MKKAVKKRKGKEKRGEESETNRCGCVIDENKEKSAVDWASIGASVLCV